MKPLIKYTGGKYREYEYFKKEIPSVINNYFEPFFGGGGVMFRLVEDDRIRNSIFISDISSDLMEFYSCIGKEEFAKEVRKIESAWNDIHSISHYFCDKYREMFANIITCKIPIENFDVVKDELKQKIQDSEALMAINYHGFSVSDTIINSVFDKIKKFKKKYETSKTIEESKNVFREKVKDIFNENFTEFLLKDTKYVTKDKKLQIKIQEEKDINSLTIGDLEYIKTNNDFDKYIKTNTKNTKPIFYLTEEELLELSCESIETSIHQGFYFTIRDMYNDWLVNKINDYTLYEKYAQWYYIREFCFGGMFRFGKDGKFNIPYGGNAYNGKLWGDKIKNLLSEETKQIFSNVNINVCDFETALSRKFEENDFIFLDPPYDSTFSEYDNNSFTREDHKRLHDMLKNVKCKWLMIIGETDFINQLYEDFPKIEYEKTYMYQARGTYDNKKTKHLIIKNY